MKALKIILAATIATLPSAAVSPSESGILFIENYYGSVVYPGHEWGRKIIYCDGTIVIEGQVTENAYLVVVNNCRGGGGVW